MVGSYDEYMFSLLRNYQTDFQSGGTILYSHQIRMKVSIAPCPHQHLVRTWVWSVILNLANSWDFCFNAQQFSYLLASFLPRGNICLGLQGIKPDYVCCASAVNSGFLPSKVSWFGTPFLEAVPPLPQMPI